METFKPHSLVFDNISQLSVTKQTSSSSVTTSSASLQQALCNWSEISSHPGLVMAMTLISNNPVVLMFQPDKIYFQEIRMLLVIHHLTLMMKTMRHHPSMLVLQMTQLKVKTFLVFIELLFFKKKKLILIKYNLKLRNCSNK